MEHDTNPEGEVADDDLVNRLAGLLSDGDEPEQENESEESAQPDEAEDESETEAPKVRLHRVKVADQELEVSEDELKNGYQRHADYTRKTQELAEQRKADEAERQQVKQERALYAQRLQMLAQQLAPPQVDLEALKANDPIAYIEAVKNDLDRQQKQAWVHQEQQRVYAQQQQEDYQQRAAALAEGAKRLAELIPEYADDAKRPAVQAAIRSYAQSVGFSADELAEASDPRAVVVLNKARLYDELLAKAAKVKPTVVQAAKPGVTRAPVNQSRKALERLKQTGSEADAIAALKALL